MRRRRRSWRSRKVGSFQEQSACSHGICRAALQLHTDEDAAVPADEGMPALVRRTHLGECTVGDLRRWTFVIQRARRSCMATAPLRSGSAESSSSWRVLGNPP